MACVCPQVKEHSLRLQHDSGDPDLAHLHRQVTNGKEHLVLCGQPVLQVPLLLQSLQHDEILRKRI